MKDNRLKFIKHLQKLFTKELKREYGGQKGLYCRIDKVEYSFLEGLDDYTLDVKGVYGKEKKDKKTKEYEIEFERGFKIILNDSDTLDTHLAGRFCQVLEDIEMKK